MADDLEILWDGPARARHTLALAPGAGAPAAHPFMARIAEGLGKAGVRVARFDFPYMRRRAATGRRSGPDRQPVLLAAWRQVIEALGGGAGLVIGGKSMGGRMASLVADEAGVRGLVCLGYPFHPPGQPGKLRTAHLERLTTPTLVLQGTRDPFGRPEEIAGYPLSKTIRVVHVPDGDHSLVPRKKSGRSEEENLAFAVERILAFLEDLDG